MRNAKQGNHLKQVKFRYKRQFVRPRCYSFVNQQCTRLELVISDRKLIYCCVLKLPVKLRYFYFFSNKIICINNFIPATNLSVKLDMHFIHSLTHEIQIYLSNCVAFPKEDSSHCLLNFLVWNTSRYKQLYTCLFLFMVLFCNFLGAGLNSLVHCNF